jgi:hypothetical protein
LSSAEVRASRLKCWKTKPSLRLRTRGQFVAGELRDFLAVQPVAPPLGWSRQPSRFMKVDLPEPDGPITATNSPAAMSRLTPHRAGTTLLPMT